MMQNACRCHDDIERTLASPVRLNVPPMVAIIRFGHFARIVDELVHIGRRMRRIALQSAAGGMALSFAGMALAAAGYLPPVAGAVTQEIIDIAAVLNALRVAIPSKKLTDF